MPRSTPLSIALLATAAVITSGCKPAAEPPTPTASATAVAASPSASSSATAVSGSAGSASAVKVENADYSFAYAWPAAAGGIPALKAWLEADRARIKADLVSDAAQARADAAKDGFPFRPYGSYTEWLVVTDLPGWLSLTAIRSTYEGGAHGMNWTDGLLWDKAADKRREVTDFFTSAEALGEAIRPGYCNRLDSVRAKRRNALVNRKSGDQFDACIDPMQQTLILGSSDNAHFDRIGVIAAPYEAGPYAEGQYDVTVPVTAQIIALVKPEYRAAFAVGR